MKKAVFKATLAALGLGLMGSPAFAECGNVQIANMNWASAELIANIDALILEHGYQCDVELIPGDTNPTFASMNEKGRPDIAPEQWINALRDPYFEALKEGRLVNANKNPINSDLGEGWWVTDAFYKAHPELDTVVKILDHPELFPSAENPDKGAFITCPSGWGCQISNANLFRAFKMEDKGWEMIDPGSAAGLDGSMTKAAERGEFWFGYYWSPTAMVGKNNMHLIPFGVDYAGDENWNHCISKPVEECADPKPSAWTVPEVNTVITKDFHERGGDTLTYLEKRVIPGKVINEMLVFMLDEQAGGEDAAIHFMKTHSDIWKTWLPSDIAGKLEETVASL